MKDIADLRERVAACQADYLWETIVGRREQ